MQTPLHKWFALLGLVLLVLFGIMLYMETQRDWIEYQEEYVTTLRQQIAAQGKDEEVVMPGIQQLDLKDLQRMDRCTTCHLGADDPTFRGANQPLQTHSGTHLKLHPLEEFGCSACHGGQGLATTFEGAAHEELRHWEEPILPLAYTEANCGTCHTSRDVPTAPLLSEGRQLISRFNCAGCHDIPGYLEGEVWGIPLSLDLGSIGEKANPNWLAHWLKDPRVYLDRPRMPQFDLSDEEIRSLAAFLAKQKRQALEPLPPDAGRLGNVERGGTLFRESRCISCHAVNGKGGTLAPDLGRVANKVTPEWLYNFIKKPHSYAPHTKMLAYNFAEQDVLDLVAYLQEDLFDPDFPVDSPLVPPAENDDELFKKGQKLFQERGCMGCHTIEGIKNPGRIGPSLAFVGSRTADTLDFGPVRDIKRNLPNWLVRKLTEPRVFDPKAKMPDYHFTDKEAAKITIALMSLKDVPYAARKKVPITKAPVGIFNPSAGPFNPQGEFGHLFAKFRCLSCHQVYGRGGTLSTVPLDREGSQVKREWLVKYLQIPSPLRPQVIERMPVFRMTQEEAELMASYMLSVFVDDSIPVVDETAFSDGERAQGEYLFGKYGCKSCHILGKDGGYVGPDLNPVGNRLRAGWIIEWLRRPLYYRPRTIQPDYGINEEEARALAAFLMTKKGEIKK